MKRLRTPKNFSVKSIEQIALEFLKNEAIKENVSDLSRTIVDDDILNNQRFLSMTPKSFQKENVEHKNIINSENKTKESKFKRKNDNFRRNLNVIKFFKVPPKVLREEDEETKFSFSTHNSIASKITSRNSSSGANNLKFLKYDKNLTFNIDFETAYKSISDIYLPLLKNLASIETIKFSVSSCLKYAKSYFTGNSFFNLKSNILVNKNLNIKSRVIDFFEQEKIFEYSIFDILLFIIQVVLEVKLDFIQSFNEENIFVVYKEIYSAFDTMLSNIMLILSFNQNIVSLNESKSPIKIDGSKVISSIKTTNKNSVKSIKSQSYENSCLKLVKEYFKNTVKINNEQIINRLNINTANLQNSLTICVDIISSTMISYKTQMISSTKNTNEKTPLDNNFEIQFKCFQNLNNYLVKNINRSGLENLVISKSTKIKSFSEGIENKLLPTFIKQRPVTSLIYEDIIKSSINYYNIYYLLLEKSIVKIPYLPPLNATKYNYTLIVDLDETLVHFVENIDKSYVQIRPYADHFLTNMGKIFELVVFTAASEDYADIVLNELDKNHSIAYRLYRRHASSHNGTFVKDLSKLGRDLKKVCIIDNSKESFSFQPENGLLISSFLGDSNDEELLYLSSDLMKIIRSKKEDIRPIIKDINIIMKKRYKEKSSN